MHSRDCTHLSLSKSWQWFLLVCPADNYCSITAVCSSCSCYCSDPGNRKCTSACKGRVVPSSKHWGRHLPSSQRPRTGDETFEVDYQEDHVEWQHLQPVGRFYCSQWNVRLYKADVRIFEVVRWIREERASRTKLLYFILTGVPYWCLFIPLCRWKFLVLALLHSVTRCLSFFDQFTKPVDVSRRFSAWVYELALLTSFWIFSCLVRACYKHSSLCIVAFGASALWFKLDIKRCYNLSRIEISKLVGKDICIYSCIFLLCDLFIFLFY